MTLDELITTWDGKQVDVDKSFGPQCWDWAALYSQAVVGVPGNQSYGLPTGDGSAAGVFLNFQAPLPQFYDKIAYSSGGYPLKGNIVVWNHGLPGSENNGHIAVVVDGNPSGFNSYDQNWSANHVQKINHNYNYVLGWLRPKGNEMQPIDLESAIELSDSLWGWDRSDEHTAILNRDIVGKPWPDGFSIMYNHPWRTEYAQHVDKLEADAANPPGQTVLKPGVYKVG